MQLDLVDVFGNGALSGNPLAVVRGGEGLGTEAMIALTRWIGFSETTFLLPPVDPRADYRVRIFTPGGELPFAGHPTLGSCHAWLAAGGAPASADAVMQECGVGLIEVRRDGERLAFRAPPLTRSGLLDTDELEQAARLAGVDPADVVEAVHVANGPGWQLLRLATVEQVLAARPVPEAPAGTDVGLAAPYPAGSALDWELRAFFSAGNGTLREDPVTGSFNAGVAMHLFGSGLARGSYVAGQGQCTGADGHVHCSQDGEGGVWIGGSVTTVAAGAQLSPF